SLRRRGKPGALDRLLLAGDLASLPGAAEKLGRDLGVPVEPVTLAPPAAQAAQGPGSDFALALGLALRAQQPRGRLNFRKGEFAFTRDLSRVRGQMGRVAIAAAVLLVLAIGLGAEIGRAQSELQSRGHLVCRLLLEKKKKKANRIALAQLETSAFIEFRLPEAFAAYHRSLIRFPVPYPTACNPQHRNTSSINSSHDS